jgi:hypothetical protein
LRDKAQRDPGRLTDSEIKAAASAMAKHRAALKRAGFMPGTDFERCAEAGGDCTDRYEGCTCLTQAAIALRSALAIRLESAAIAKAPSSAAASPHT